MWIVVDVLENKKNTCWWIIPSTQCTALSISTGWAKKRGHKLMAIILSNLEDPW